MSINSILDSIGRVPLVRLCKISTGNVCAKAEFLNPGGSIKDRVAKHIIEKAMQDGTLRPGMIIIEATSGNTGIGLSLVGIQYGFRVICVMPENVSEERRKIIHAFGGETVLTPADENLEGCLQRMRSITETEPQRYFVVNQFANPRNPEVHYQQTGPEIWQDANNEIDVFVAGIGSGGTLQGIGKFMIEKNPKVKIVAGLHKIQGIGDGFVPSVLDINLLDMVITVTDEEAIETTRKLALEEGLLVGTSSGANVCAALQIDSGRKKVVTVLPDRAERYFSTALI
jgi:cysteine synthase